MSQVLRVAQYTGKYEFLNKDGRVVGEDCSSYPMDSADADVLMERIRQGYTYVSGGHYIVRLELNNLSDDGYFEITELVTFDYDDDGYPIPVTHSLITDRVWDALMITGGGSPNGPTIQMAVFDYEAKTLRYIGDVFAEEFTLCHPLLASRAQWSDEIRIDILNNAVRIVMEGQPVHVSTVPMYFN